MEGGEHDAAVAALVDLAREVEDDVGAGVGHQAPRLLGASRSTWCHWPKGRPARLAGGRRDVGAELAQSPAEPAPDEPAGAGDQDSAAVVVELVGHRMGIFGGEGAVLYQGAGAPLPPPTPPRRCYSPAPKETPLPDNLEGGGYDKEEEYFYRKNKELLERKRAELDAAHREQQGAAQGPALDALPQVRQRAGGGGALGDQGRPLRQLRRHLLRRR